MTLAKGMRPEGPYILHKLEKYQSMRKVLSDGEFRIGNLNFEFGGSATFVLLSTFAAGNYEKNEAKLLKKSIEEGEVKLSLSWDLA
jgi:hypothetical protein